MSSAASEPTLSYTGPRDPQIPLPALELLSEGGQGPVLRPPWFLEDETEVTIGRAPGRDGLELTDRRASRCHARLQTYLLRVRLTDTSRNGTYVNGHRIKETHILKNGDIIRVGDSLFILRYVSREPPQDAEVPRLLGPSEAMATLRHNIAQFAPTDATVLILGETGTGKEVVARSLHDLSGRSGPFVAVNCSAIPDSLAENMLFGHAKGAFTGALSAHSGYFLEANEGTLFLDELGELPAMIQPKLLRVLEERVVTPLGQSQPVPFNVRIVAATNADLAHAVEEGRFRADLFARLSEIKLHTPPLRERRQDILPLLMNQLGPFPPPMSARLLEALVLYAWPHNVRELGKVAKELSIRGRDAPRLELSMIEERLRCSSASRPKPSESLSSPPPSKPPPPKPSPRKSPPTREAFAALVEETQGNISKMSRILGRSRRQIHRYLEMFDIDLKPS